MSSTDWLIVFIYLVIVTLGGLYFTRRANKGLMEYFLSNRCLPWWLAGTSMVATSFSCDTPLYVTKLVRTRGIFENWQWWSFLVGGMLSAFLLSKLWRRAEVLTDVELTELRYSGLGASVLRGFRAFYLAIPINCIAMGWVLLAMAKINLAILGWPKWGSIILYAGSAFLYSLLSGFWGVVVTDFIQFILAMTGAIVFSIYSLKAAGGLNNVISFISSQPETYKDTLHFIPSMTFNGALGAAFIGFLTYNLVQWWANLNSDGGGKVIQRIMACKDEKHALGSVLWYNFAHFVLRSWPWILTALASIKLYPLLADPEMAYPKMVAEILPVGIKGLVVASLVAAFMSTIDTQMNWGASYLTNDLYKRFLNPGKGERHYLNAARIATLLLVVLASFAAYFTESVTEAFKFIIAFGAGTGPIYLLRWFWWRINAWSEISAMIASSIISISLYSITDVDYAWKLLITVSGSAIVWITVAFLTPKTSEATLKQFYRRVRPGGFWGVVKIKSGFPPDSLRTAFTNTILGIVILVSFIVGIGKLFLHQSTMGIIALFIAGFGSYWLYHRLRKSRQL